FPDLGANNRAAEAPTMPPINVPIIKSLLLILSPIWNPPKLCYFRFFHKSNKAEPQVSAWDAFSSFSDAACVILLETLLKDWEKSLTVSPIRSEERRVGKECK